MSGPATLIIFGILLLAIGIFFMMKPSLDRTRTYNNTLKIVNAKCVIVCKYISGLPDLIEHISCYLFADDERLTIMPVDNKNVKISLQLSKIKSFQYISPIGAATITEQQGKNGSIVILYISENSELMKITFSLVVSIHENIFNQYAIYQCDINEFVNARIPKQKINLEL